MKNIKVLFLAMSAILCSANALKGYAIDITVSKGAAPAEITQEYLRSIGGKPIPIKMGPIYFGVISDVRSIAIKTEEGKRLFVPNCDGEWQEVPYKKKDEKPVGFCAKFDGMVRKAINPENKK